MLGSLPDRRLALAIGVGLFVLAAWPLAFIGIPPYQDLPGHLGAVSVLASPERYPELLPTGFLKPNSFFFVWTLFFSHGFGIVTAAKLFVAMTLAATALVLPRFVLHFTDRRRMLLATPFLVPMVHNWFVSMGMLNFAASVPVALLLVMELDRRSAEPRTSLARAAVLALVAWYLHPFSVIVVGLLAVAAVAEDRRRLRTLVPPLVPAGLLAAFVLARHAAVAGPKMDPPVYSQIHWALYNLWSQWMYGFTELTAASIVPAIVLAVLAAARWREGRVLLGGTVLVVLAIAYFVGPYVAFDANYITPRLVPFLWAAALVRIPSRLPRWLVATVSAASVVYAIGMPIDLFRLSRELDDYAAAMPVIPDGARLIQLNFNGRPTSKNTFSVGTAWGLYVMRRHTSAIDVWANVPSMPFVRETPLPPQLEPMSRLRLVKNAASAERFCADRRASGFVVPAEACEALWRAEWERFWGASLPRFDHVLLWDPPAPVLTTLPADFTPSFAKGKLRVYSRGGGMLPEP